MKLDLDKYRVNIAPIKMLLDTKEPEDRVKFISAIAVSTGCPIVAVCHFVGELYGYTAELEEKIDLLSKFYKVTEVVGIRRSA